MNKTFELNGKVYRTDRETLEVLRSLLSRYRTTNDPSAVMAVMMLGLKIGRIVEAEAAR